MIDLEIDGTTYKLPTGWSEVNLQLYNDIVNLYANLNEDDSVLNQAIESLVVILNCSKSEVEGLTRRDFGNISDECTWMESEPEVVKLKNEYIINGVTYILPKSLDDMTIGENASIEGLIKEDETNLAGMIAVILRPAIEKYNTTTGETEYTIEKFNTDSYTTRRQLILENLSSVDALSIMSFFFLGEITSSESSKDTLVKGK